MKSKDAVIIVLCLLLLYFVFLKDNNQENSTDSYVNEIKSLNEEIAYWDSLSLVHLHFIDSLSKANSQLIITRDSIAQSKIKIKHVYHEIYKNIPFASNSQLDSLIRSNW